MAPHLSGTSPASRSATPTPPLVRNSSNAATGSRRSSIVPFIRPGSSGPSEDGGQGSFKSSEDALQRISHSLQHRRTSSSTSRDLESTSLGDCSTSLCSLRRPEPRKSGQFARGSGFVRKEGFQTEQLVGPQQEGQKTSPRPPVSPHGLLSRQFSSDSLQPAAVPQKSSSDALKVSCWRFEMCMLGVCHGSSASHGNQLSIYTCCVVWSRNVFKSATRSPHRLWANHTK